MAHRTVGDDGASRPRASTAFHHSRACARAHDPWCILCVIAVVSLKESLDQKSNGRGGFIPPVLSALRPQPSNGDFRGQELLRARSCFALLPIVAGLLLVGGAVRLLPIRSCYHFHGLLRQALDLETQRSSVLICSRHTLLPPTRLDCLSYVRRHSRKMHNARFHSSAPDRCVRGYVGAIGRHARTAKRDEILSDGAGGLESLGPHARI
jgi:hypothetical protein